MLHASLERVMQRVKEDGPYDGLYGAAPPCDDGNAHRTA